VELRIRGERAVLAGPGGESAREIDPHSLAIGAELAEALHEWARVAAAVRRSGEDTDASAGEHEAAAVVSQRGRQLATRVAAVMGTPVHYLDPVTQAEVLIEPPAQPADDEAVTERQPSVFERLFGTPDPAGEPTPWPTGLTVAGFVAAVIIVAMLALAGALAHETSGWFTVLCSVLVTAGIAPSLWLGRKVPILRWAALGAAVGVVVSWVGVLVVAL
jgi:hypothetical protein